MFDISIPKIGNKWWLQAPIFGVAITLAFWFTRSAGIEAFASPIDPAKIIGFGLCLIAIERIIRFLVWLVILLVNPSFINRET